ncbi:PREDICTED: LOW QUALITY PROTEIN: probable glycosyltransferase At3g42180 [Populus euphratica]|uniref:LOW QUALITY PROTEIN: probable glycosyltransferase At3g42180 n=1 Tax=Populus euphratica TaxID=75702 RepID=A0AAJ6TQI3_POPEU|nr:PREDICTED: LOW QUALITY PROTEIN: probable glycosyltransferase At3g42180 [Populus euphratica]
MAAFNLDKLCLILAAFLFLLLLFPLGGQHHLTLLFSSFNPIKANSSTTPLEAPVLLDAFASTSINTSDEDEPKTHKKRSSLERVEEGLSKARAAIQEAIRSKNYTSHKKETFIPKGSVYWNSHTFLQSHIEMVKTFKVWPYKEGERPLVHDGPLNNIYSIEGHFIDEVESKGSPFRAQDPEEAHVFFLPFSVAFIMHFIYLPITAAADYSRDRLPRVVTDYVHIVAKKYPYWKRSNGADHFMVSCHDWAPDVSIANSELFNKFIRVLCNANISVGFRHPRDVPLPEIYLPPFQLGPTHMGRAPNNRPILAFFEGRAPRYIRQVLFKHWKNKDNEVQVHELLPKGKNYTRLMGQSKFCLCPSGSEVASPRVVEAIYQGCVPVIISNNYSLPFSDVLNWSQFSVQIPVEKIPEIKMILQRISNSKYLRMHERIKRVQRHFVLNRPAKPFDVIHMVLHSLWLRRLNFRLSD